MRCFVSWLRAGCDQLVVRDALRRRLGQVYRRSDMELRCEQL